MNTKAAFKGERFGVLPQSLSCHDDGDGMKSLACGLILSTTLITPAVAMDQSLVRQFKKLDPQTRLEQRCDTEAMDRINADETEYRPDKVIAYSFADPLYEKNQIKAPGAVFRSKGEWYRLKFKCVTGPDHIEVLSLKYKI